MALISPKLFSSCNDGEIFTVSGEYSALTWGDINFAIIRVVNVDIGCDVKNEILTVVAIVDIVLLAFY